MLNAKRLRPRGGEFAADPEVRDRLDSAVRAFASGYNAALAVPRGQLDLSYVPHEFRGFAYEGAAMSRTLLDLLTLSRGRRLAGLADGPGRRYTHLLHVGAGWAFARLHMPPWRTVRFGDGLLRRLAWDGWGFHQAYFRPGDVFGRQRVERAARGPAAPVRDQGAGRALWFHAGADPQRIAGVIAAFPERRRADLWAGVGLAAAYTGALPAPRLPQLTGAAAGYRDHLAQGAAFAAKAHVLSGEVPEPSRAAIQALCGVAAPVAAGWTDDALRTVGDGDDPAGRYERWRAEIRGAWRAQGGAA
ncbi:DUF1702 family protein [Actinomadura miaoliensis]